MLDEELMIDELKSKLLDKYGYDEEELDEMSDEDIKKAIDDIEDTSWAHPNENWDEFVEHENFGG